MSAVVALPGVTVVSADPRPNVIKLIEELLVEAKAGAIQTFAAVTIGEGGHIGTCFATGGLPHAHHLVAGAVYLLRRAENNAGLEP